jgi:hypothetical protein
MLTCLVGAVAGNRLVASLPCYHMCSSAPCASTLRLPFIQNSVQPLEPHCAGCKQVAPGSWRCANQGPTCRAATCRSCSRPSSEPRSDALPIGLGDVRCCCAVAPMDCSSRVAPWQSGADKWRKHSSSTSTPAQAQWDTLQPSTRVTCACVASA